MPQHNQQVFRTLTEVVRKASSQFTMPTIRVNSKTELFRATSEARLPHGVSFDPRPYLLRPHDPAASHRFSGGGVSSGVYFSKAEGTLQAEFQRGVRKNTALESTLAGNIVATMVPLRLMKLANFSVNTGDGQDFIYRVNQNPEVQRCLEHLGRPNNGLLEAVMDPVDHSAGIGFGLAALDIGCEGVLSTSAKYEALNQLWNTNILALAREQVIATPFEVVALSKHTFDEVIPVPLVYGLAKL